MTIQMAALAAATMLAVAGAAEARGPREAGAVPGPAALDDDADAAAQAAFDASLRQEERTLRADRAHWPALFARAYARYPALPRGSLEAIAFVQTRWQPLQQAAGDPHHAMPGAWGPMGLYAGDGFDDQVGEAAALLGVDPAAVRRDPATNILAGAALLERALRGRKAATIEDLAPALSAYAGFGDDPGVVAGHARESFAYDVLLALDRGVDDKGMVVPQRAVAWERAFAPAALVRQRAPFVRLDVAGDKVEVDGWSIDPVTETLQPPAGDRLRAASTDYGPALWNAAHASNYTASRSAAVSAVTIHTAQGSYAGTISWFKNPAANVSAHYVIRSSDGQVTQMVRHGHTGWHVGNHNSYTLGIEHEGYVSNSSWYTTAMYNASAALVRHFCASYAAISCASAYGGAPGSGINVLPATVKVKGHQHFSGQTHTDPGIHWNWAHYRSLLNPGGGGGGGTRILDSFESGVGHFNTAPAYSGSTTGISAASTATRNCSTRRNGSCSLQVLLKDNPSSNAAWSVRLLSGSGSPGANTAITRANGSVGFWVYSGGSGMRVGIGLDDSDGTERSVMRTIAANAWTYVSWSLTDAAQWTPWVGNANGAITASSVTVDAIWIERAQTSYDVNLYIDDVQARN